MVDPDPETRYFNTNTGALEWRCKYCPKVYDLNGGTAVITDHLTASVTRGAHNLERDSARDSHARNQQISIHTAIQNAATNP